MRFIHTADWQIGMTFHGFKEKSRIMMEDDRLEVIEAIGDYAKDPKNEIDFVLVCGDMFDTPRVAESLIKKTFKKIERKFFSKKGSWKLFIKSSNFINDKTPANHYIVSISKLQLMNFLIEKKVIKSLNNGF